MRILFTISLVSCLALIAAVIAFLRYIRAARARAVQRSFADHFIHAEATIPRRGERSIAPQNVRDIIRDKQWNPPGTASRKPPQSSIQDTHYNQDLEDLSAPRLRASSGSSSVSPKRR